MDDIAELKRKLCERTVERDEAIAQQAATTEVLQVINASPDDLAPVFDAIVDKAVRLCHADGGALWLVDGDVARPNGGHGGNMPERFYDYVADKPVPVKYLLGRDARDQPFVHVADLKATLPYQKGIPFFVANIELGGVRTSLNVPMVEAGAIVGVFTLIRWEVRPFTDKQIAVVQSFAAQAQAAMKNASLMKATSESLQQQIATADVLKVISRSGFDLQAVLDTLIGSAARLCESDSAAIFKRDGDLYRWSANFGNPPELEEFARSHPFKAGKYAVTPRVALEGKTIHVADVLADPEYGASEHQKLGGYRTILGVPLLREGTPTGVFVLTREQVKPFTKKQIELVETFADQAVIAIENVRLFDEVQTRTKELAASLDELRTAQDRLVQTEKLASLGQLTAGIAHEIKNPLNFVNNFSSLSAELIDELNDTLKPATLDDGVREEIDDLTQMLKSNLQKVVQHGKRADSIVKNMLLHSRQGSGEHRTADINSIVEESLNLAYHGARAENSGFSVTLHRDFASDVGMIETYPQEITRVFLNLISNGFYAVTKRKEAADATFDPTLSVSTKNLGDRIEIRIRDNGTGISAEVKETMFNPFFTTKPAGEGTGLGLSMSHDIVVKQHGGTIRVDTELGAFTEFIITLPRTAVAYT
jgi:signal transduction histidine kinase